MSSFLSPLTASILMLAGVIPAVVIIYLLREEWKNPGVLWFLLSMATGGLWAFLFATFTLVQSPTVTLALANFFWATVPTAAVTMFLFGYEYVSRKPASNTLIIALFLPILVLFFLSWTNPNNLVYTSSYHVDAAGILHFEPWGGIVKVLVVKVYGYLLVTVAAGMFIGEVIRSTKTRRRQALYILLVFSTLALSTIIKVANLVPIYFDPTSVVFSLSGLAFAISTHQSGFLKSVPIAREHTFEEVKDAILVVGPSGRILDANIHAYDLFDNGIIDQDVQSLLTGQGNDTATEFPVTVTFDREGKQRFYSLQRSKFEYGRGAEGEILVLSDITPVKERENDLELFKQILSRVFRHNLRNDLMVINGFADLIGRETDGEIHAHAEKIKARTSDLINKTEKARVIEEIFTEEKTRYRSVDSIVEYAMTEIQIGDDVSIQTDIENYLVEAHPKLELALMELVENAIVHNTFEEQAVIHLSTSKSGDYVTVAVEDNGPGIPEMELDVLRAEEETDLKHGSGLGLWLVRWIVDRSNGELSATVNDEGSRIEIRLKGKSATNHTEETPESRDDSKP